MKLRPYQQEAADAGLKALSGTKPGIVVVATGGGKSLIIAEIARHLPNVLVLQPTKEILEQNYQKLLGFETGIDVGIYSASMKSKEIRQVTYATIGSIYRKPELFKHFKHVIIDECHQVNPKNLGGMYTKFLREIDCDHVLGLTATPYRLQQKFFHENGQMVYTSHLKMINRIHPFFWKNIVHVTETAELIEQGYLAPIKYKALDVDWDQLEINTTGADFTEASLERYWSDARLKKLALTIQMIDKHCQRNLIFCSSIRQATRAVNMLSDMGVGAALITGKTPMEERTDMIGQFRRGELRHMVNVGVFTTGFDVPELDSIVLARPTMSLALYYQMVGRGVRKDPARPDKMLRVFDFAGCVKKLGKVETIRLRKEDDGFRDKVVSEVGEQTEVPLFKFVVKKQMFKKG
jgi:DNA repair protein RadD